MIRRNEITVIRIEKAANGFILNCRGDESSAWYPRHSWVFKDMEDLRNHFCDFVDQMMKDGSACSLDERVTMKPE